MTTGLSIVVPTRGPGEPLRSMLRSLNECLPPEPSTEVIVVVDGPGDVTPDLVGLTIRPKVLTTGGSRGPATARNLGAAAAAGDVLAFLDDDVIVPVTWFPDVTTVSGDPTWDLIGGPIRSLSPNNPVSQMFEALIIRHGRVDGRWHLTGANLLVRRAAFDMLGGFDERFAVAAGEDWDLSRRAHRLRLEVRVMDGAPVHHRNPTRLRALTSRARRYAASSPLRFTADRRAGEGEANPVLEAAQHIRQGRPSIRRGSRLVVVQLMRRYREVRALGFGRRRSALLLLLHAPWFVTYAVTTGISLRRASQQAGDAVGAAALVDR